MNRCGVGRLAGGDWSRREALRTGAIAGVVAGALAARPWCLGASSSNCPELAGERVRCLVGWSAGGGYDAYARLLEPELERRLDAQVVVENVPGAGGVLAARRLMTAAPNGRTIAVLNGTGLALAAALRLPIVPDFVESFTVLGRIVSHRQAFIVGAGSEISSLEDAVALGRRRPLVMAVTGLATVNTLLTALLEPLFGIEIEVVAGYPGSREIMAAAARGEIDGAVAGIETPLPLDTVKIILRFERGDGLEASQDMAYAGIPALSGPNGVLTEHPELFTRSEVDVESTVTELLALMEVGRILVAPPGLPNGLQACLRSTVMDALHSPSFRAAATRARRTVAAASAEDVLRHVALGRQAAARYEDMMSDLIRRSNLSR